ncbi:MAG: 1-acyl-sn-glycerol-3-phosphate acyltransferase [Methylococcales bacterium]|nr:1-acyl-sn-glycerol-3-phosphate acyltransferase [Methylococcales bacterium]
MLRTLFYLLFVKPLVLVMLGISVRGREHLPMSGPAIVVANHNSHLDTMALMSLFPLSVINKVHPVAAADYFLRNPIIKWFALNIAGIIPLERRMREKGCDIFIPVIEALDCGSIVIIFPEGTRGEPETMSKLKNGISHLLSERPDVPVIPVFFHGLGKCLPKGEVILVPFFIDAFIGEPLYWAGGRQLFMDALVERMHELQKKAVVIDDFL